MEKKCLSKCYKKNTFGVHPLLSDEEFKKSFDFCFTDMLKADEIKKCDIEKTYKNTHLNILLFNERYILNNIYNIHEWHDIIDFINNTKYENIKTLNRILDYSWILFENKWYNEILNIIEIYKNYFLIKKKNISDQKINDFIFKLKKDYLSKANNDIKKFHDLIQNII